MTCLATLDDLRRHLGLRADETADDARLYAVLESASAGFERACGRAFEPRFAARSHSLAAASDTLSLADDLLSLTALADAGGVLPLEAVERIPADGPAALLRLTGGLRFLSGPVVVTGWWGWQDAPAAWSVPTGQTVQDAPLQSASTQLTVGSVATFSPGCLLRIDNELLRVTVVPTTPGPLTVVRGLNGTTAVAHPQGTPIQVCLPPPDVRDLVLRRAAWLTRRAEPLPDSLEAPALRWRRDRVDGGR
jgi:hypothetical protein